MEALLNSYSRCYVHFFGSFPEGTPVVQQKVLYSPYKTHILENSNYHRRADNSMDILHFTQDN